MYYLILQRKADRCILKAINIQKIYMLLICILVSNLSILVLK